VAETTTKTAEIYRKGSASTQQSGEVDMINQILCFLAIGLFVIGVIGCFVGLFFMIKNEEEYFNSTKRGG